MMNKRKSVAVGEMVLMISFSFAIAFTFGQSVGVVSGFAIPPNWIGRDPGSLHNLDPIASTGPSAATLPTGEVAGRFGVIKSGKFVPTPNNIAGATHYSTSGSSLMEVSSGKLLGTVDASGAINPVASSVETTAPVVGQGELAGLMKGTYFGANVGSAVLSGALWGVVAGGIAYGVASMMGLNDASAAGVGLGIGVGTAVGSGLYFVGQNLGPQSFIFSPLGSIIAGGVVAGAIILATYTKEKTELVKFECYPWEAPTGGLHCEECNDDELPCSEYRCKSLGQACDIINPGTVEEKCIWIGKGDTTAPKIEPWEEPLLEGLSYIPDRAVSPPNRGFKIVDSAGDECLPAFLDFEFGVIADEPAQCKIGFFATNDYDNSSNEYFGGNNLFLEEHTQFIKVPTPFSEDEIAGDLTIGSDGTYKLWVRCIDANGNGGDSAEVVFSFCVDEGPDVTQPIIKGTSIVDGSPVRFGVDSIENVELYVNEPSDCKWSREDKAYEAMENVMECASELYQFNTQLNYVCKTTLTGIVDGTDNKFYFRCIDNSDAPGGRNEMTSSYGLTLKGTEKLVIKETGPIENQTGSSDIAVVNLSVETSHGAEEGNSICYYSLTKGEFEVPMEGEGFMHTQQIDLSSGEYTYFFRCIDLGGNVAEGNTTFSVIVDKDAPKVTRVFRDGNKLKVITDEEAKCYYSLNNCNYNIEDAANALTYEDPRERSIHVTDWDENKIYYIKCEDFRGRQPDPDKCQLIVKASEL